ncbi:MAG TPA: HAMP domain-containing sensor histidine kinase [Baekduia sp.]|uniref:sensor histidine kinase n=1 Tax=Baekduia sp. TaxID=2600305 RepID=UPI002B57E866|nr:HAMP domain-containing sensor histidine kinase [Baekduia sp.]HMJ36872.1 HAMP domain-containing sensor histidine kinase [Baekduia sp.]
MRSLRGRLTLGVLLVLAAALAVAGALAFDEVDASERSALDDRLKRTAELSRPTAVAAVQQEVPEDDPRLDAVLRATGSSLRLRLGRVTLLDTGAPPPSRPRSLPSGLSTFTAAGQRYRAYVTTLSDRDLGGLGRLEVVSSLRGVDRRISDLQRRLALLALAALAVVGAAVWLLTSLVLRPLRRLQAVASSVAGDEDLDRRVPSDDGPAELRSLATSFNAMLARLGRSAGDRERALAATRRFAADAGHELRTPLTSVQAALSTLRRHPDLAAPRRGDMLDDALDQQRRMVDLLDGLQALARGDAGPLEHTSVDLADLVDGVVTAAAARHPELALTAELPEAPVVVEGWEPGLRLLVENLVSNAARHGRGGEGTAGRVHVALSGGNGADAGGPVLTVDDDGPGVPAGERERIFAPFARIDGTDRPGSGLGLALVAQQAGHHGAGVEVGDAPLGGARFTVRF